MRLLFDQNLSPRLVAALDDLFPGSTHVRSVGLVGAVDELIWAYALQNGFTILSKDKDFVEMSVRLGAPPKVISLRLGNTSTRFVEAVLRDAAHEIEAFLAEPNLNMLSIET